MIIAKLLTFILGTSGRHVVPGELESSSGSPKESSRSMRSGLECTAVLKMLTALMAFRNLRLALEMFCRHRGGMAAAQHEVPVEGGGCRAPLMLQG